MNESDDDEATVSALRQKVVYWARWWRDHNGSPGRKLIKALDALDDAEGEAAVRAKTEYVTQEQKDESRRLAAEYLDKALAESRHTNCPECGSTTIEPCACVDIALAALAEKEEV